MKGTGNVIHQVATLDNHLRELIYSSNLHLRIILSLANIATLILFTFTPFSLVLYT